MTARSWAAPRQYERKADDRSAFSHVEGLEVLVEGHGGQRRFLFRDHHWTDLHLLHSHGVSRIRPPLRVTRNSELVRHLGTGSRETKRRRTGSRPIYRRRLGHLQRKRGSGAVWVVARTVTRRDSLRAAAGREPFHHRCQPIHRPHRRSEAPRSRPVTSTSASMATWAVG